MQLPGTGTGRPEGLRYIAISTALVAVIALGPQPLRAEQGAQGRKPAASKPTLSVWKTSTCGCCGLWVEHMKANGFTTLVVDVTDLDAVKRKLGVPANLASCHTATVGGFVVEGHIPADAVHRLLKERPAVAGIAVPGMPIGSPGMEVPGGHKQPYSILAFDAKGAVRVYERR